MCVFAMYIYDALINALSAHMIHINLNMIFYTYIILYVNCFGRTMLYMCIEYHI